VNVRSRLLLASGGVALLVLASCSNTPKLDASLSDPGPVQEGGIPTGGPSSGQHLPTTMYDRLDGGKASFGQYAGKPLVVNVWASWCAPCVQEMPAFERVHQSVKDGVTFIGIDSSDNRDDAKALATKTGVTYDLLYDPTGSFVSATGAVSLPSTFFVDADGKIVAAKTGALDEAGLRRRLQELFNR